MTGHRQPWYLDRLRAELERVAAIEDRRERGPALGRLRPLLDRLRPWPQTLVALALVAALVAVVVTVTRESDVERPAAHPGREGRRYRRRARRALQPRRTGTDGAAASK